MIWAQIVTGFDKKITPLNDPAPLPATHKRCKQCSKVLPVEAFYARGEGNRRASRCKPCYIEYQKSLGKRKGKNGNTESRDHLFNRPGN